MLYLLHGENSYESWHELKKIQNEFLKKNPEAELATFNNEDIDAKRVSFDNYGFFAKKKLYVLKYFFDGKKSNIESLYDSFIDDEEVDLIIWQEKKVDKRSKIYKGMNKKGVVREFENLKGAKFRSWVTSKVKKLSHPDLVSTLVERFEGNQWIVESEVEKLSLIAKDGKLTDSDLEVMTRLDTYDTWDLVNKVFSGNKVGALRFIDNLRINNGDEFMILGSIVSQLRSLMLVSIVNHRQEILKKNFGMHPFSIQKSLKYLSRFDKNKLKKSYNQFCNFDYALKRGEVEFKLGLSLLVLTL